MGWMPTIIINFHKSKLSFSLLIKLPGTLALWCFVNWCVGYLWRVEKEKSERKRTWKFTVEIFAPIYVKWFRFELFQQIRVPSLAERGAYSSWLFTCKSCKFCLALNMTMIATQSICSSEIPLESCGKFWQKSWDCERTTLLIGTNSQIFRASQFGNFTWLENLTRPKSRIRIIEDGCQ